MIYEASDESDEEQRREPVHRIVESDSERWGEGDEAGRGLREGMKVGGGGGGGGGGQRLRWGRRAI